MQAEAYLLCVTVWLEIWGLSIEILREIIKSSYSGKER